MIVGLAGYAGSGKDTAAEALAPYGYERLAFADKLKALALELNPEFGTGGIVVSLASLVRAWGWEGAKKYPGVREYLQRLGQWHRAILGEDVWVNAALAGVIPGSRSLTQALGIPNYVVTDARYQNEFDRIREMGGAIVRIERKGVGPANDHESERVLTPDHTVHNCSTPEQLARRILAAIGENA